MDYGCALKPHGLLKACATWIIKNHIALVYMDPLLNYILGIKMYHLFDLKERLDLSWVRCFLFLSDWGTRKSLPGNLRRIAGNRMFLNLPSGKLTSRWKVKFFNRKCIFKGSLFHCYASFPMCTCCCSWYLRLGIGNSPLPTMQSHHDHHDDLPRVSRHKKKWPRVIHQIKAVASWYDWMYKTMS